jgi:hypothetical protein
LFWYLQLLLIVCFGNRKFHAQLFSFLSFARPRQRARGGRSVCTTLGWSVDSGLPELHGTGLVFCLFSSHRLCMLHIWKYVTPSCEASHVAMISRR